MAADNIPTSGRFASFTKLIHSSNGGGDEAGDPWDDSPLLTRRAGDHICRPVIIGSDGRATPVMVLDALPPPHRHKEASPKFQPPASTFGSFSDGDAQDEDGRGFHWGEGRAEEWAAVVDHGGWDRPGRALEGRKMGRATNSFHATAEFLWGSARPAAEAEAAAAVAASPPSSYTLQQREKSSAVPVIDSSEAAKKYGGKFVW